MDNGYSKMKRSMLPLLLPNLWYKGPWLTLVTDLDITNIKHKVIAYYAYQERER